MSALMTWGMRGVGLVLLSELLTCGDVGRLTGPTVEEAALWPRPTERLLLTCSSGEAEARYERGVRNTPGDSVVSFSARMSDCVAVLGSAVKSATLGSGGPSMARGISCADLARAGVGRQVVTWNTAETSTLLMGRSRVSIEGAVTVVTQTGTVLSGKYEGATAVRTATFPRGDIEAGCLSEQGLTRLRGQVTLSMTYP
ncbi:hypothetical protein LZ198_38490 [Myxococcus sp. K15C18031901]|uniref:hypothetical protein n=1 Tax=Myxococcus dinghuensis TaxID=2906761 RepID=UPI0020A6E13A|nr:hypothetical protein [Myxococcus dinghuensis]MCP3104771.1 hypothetical protein [Myxococcus dinghuensis]